MLNLIHYERMTLINNIFSVYLLYLDYRLGNVYALNKVTQKFDSSYLSFSSRYESYSVKLLMSLSNSHVLTFGFGTYN